MGLAVQRRTSSPAGKMFVGEEVADLSTPLGSTSLGVHKRICSGSEANRLHTEESARKLRLLPGFEDADAVRVEAPHLVGSRQGERCRHRISVGRRAAGISSGGWRGIFLGVWRVFRKRNNLKNLRGVYTSLRHAGLISCIDDWRGLGPG